MRARSVFFVLLMGALPACDQPSPPEANRPDSTGKADGIICTNPAIPVGGYCDDDGNTLVRCRADADGKPTALRINCASNDGHCVVDDSSSGASCSDRCADNDFVGDCNGNRLVGCTRDPFGARIEEFINCAERGAEC